MILDDDEQVKLDIEKEHFRRFLRESDKNLKEYLRYMLMGENYKKTKLDSSDDDT